MDYQIINLADLKEQYCDRARAAWAGKTLRKARLGKRTANLPFLLRHHDEKEICDPETDQRDSFDFLLAYYSLLEIACLIHYIPSTFPDTFREEALWNLSHDAVKRYYETNYPTLLPHLFRLRLEGNWSLYEVDKERITHPLFLRFLGIVNRVYEDEEIELFQWFLDSGWVGDFSIADTLEILQSPPRTMDALSKDPAKRSTPEQSVNGAQKFLTFCGEFDNLLQEAQHFPIFQSEMWTYYCYWFDLIGTKVGNQLNQILESFIKWDAEDSEADLEQHRQLLEKNVNNFWNSFDPDATPENLKKELDELHKVRDEQSPKLNKKAIKEYVTGSKSLINRLFSGVYGKALRERISKADD